MCLVSNVTVSTAPGSRPGGPWWPGDTEGGMGQQLDRRSRSVAKATAAKNTAGHCPRQQSHWRIFSIISVAISSAALPGSAVPAPPGHCSPKTWTGPPTCPWVQPLCLSFPPAHCVMVPPTVPLLSSHFFHPTKSPEVPHSSPSHPRCPLPLMSAWGHMAPRTALSIQAAPVQPRQREGNSRDWRQ